MRVRGDDLKRSATGGMVSVRVVAVIVALVLATSAGPLLADSSTWSPTPATGDWNTAVNWTPAAVPNGASDVATFGMSSVTAVSTSSDTTVDSVVFSAGASSFTISVGPANNMTIDGSGLVNHSASVQNFETLNDGGVNFGTVNVTGTASIGLKVTLTNDGSATEFGGAETFFSNSSSAGHATIINQGGTAVGALNGGATMFFNGSTAGNSTMTNLPGTVVNSGGGTIDFFDNSKAGGALIKNEGAAVAAGGGELSFHQTSSADTAVISNLGGSAADGLSNGGVTDFNDSSTAGSAVITDGGGTVDNSFGGNTTFSNSSSAGASSITNGSGATALAGGGELDFFDSSTAGTAVITNNGGKSAGVTLFHDTSSAQSARIINGGGSVSGVVGGVTEFHDSSSGGQSTIVNNGGTGLGSFGGVTRFEDGSTAGTATIISNGGSGGGRGGVTLFYANADGGSARAITNHGGVFDISNISNVNTTMGIGSIEGGGTYFLGGNTLVTGSNNLSTTVSGTISDGGDAGGVGGSLIKVGTGTLTLSGINTFTGGTTLNAGALVVNSAQALGLGNVVINGGALSAGARVINVRGDYTQNPGGTLQMQVAGAAAGQYDTLTIGRNAALGGTLQVLSLGYRPKPGDQLTLITAGGVISGRFAHFLDPFSTGPESATVNLVYGRNSVLLEIVNAGSPSVPGTVTTDFSSFARTPNELAAANLLDAVQLEGSAGKLISFLNKEPFFNLANDFDKISPDSLSAFYEISFSNADIQRLLLEDRLQGLRDGSNGFSSNMNLNGASVNLESRVDADGKAAKSVVAPALQPARENRWGVWVSGFGDFVNVDGDGNGQGYNFATGGVSIGADYRISDQLAIGVMGDYSHTWTSLQNGGNIDVNSGRGGLYATWYDHGVYLDAAIYAGHNNYNSSRSGLGGLAAGNTGGTEWSTFISGGYDFHFGALTVGPIAALQYTYANIGGFTENGSLAPMQIESNWVDSLRTEVGFRLFYQWRVGKVVVEPSIRAAWEHEYLYSAIPVTAGFAGISGPQATFFGPAEGHDSAIVSVGVSVRWSPALTAYVSYDGQLWRGNYDSNAVTGGVSLSF
jgi:outer membrane autotransporter protein